MGVCVYVRVNGRECVRVGARVIGPKRSRMQMADKR